VIISIGRNAKILYCRLLFKIIRKYLWADSSVYKGEWHDNKISGKGIYTWVDGRSYSGEWLENNMSGHGVYKW